MANDHISTFEKDIENEIRTKSASLSDIAAASGVVDNKPEKNALHLVILVVIALVILIVGIVTYLYYNNLQRVTAPAVGTEVKDTKTTDVFENTKTPAKEESPKNIKREENRLVSKKLITTPLSELLPTLFPYVQKNLVKAETYQSGYIVTFSGYNEFYKTLLDNESFFLKDALLLYGDNPAEGSKFSDVRVGESDVRMATGEKGVAVYYLFIKPSTLVISDKSETLQSIVDALIK